MKKKYNMEIEGVMVEITYDFIRGYKGTREFEGMPDRVDVLSWRLLHEEEVKANNSDLDDDEWEDWMSDIDTYVHNDSEWDILEWENESNDVDWDEN